jgi:ATP-dependent exoDNAse (exonuclease V) beta subunit
LLVCALFRFPESLHYEKEERVYLDLLLKEVSDFPIFVEMRNAQWQNEEVYASLFPNMRSLLDAPYSGSGSLSEYRHESGGKGVAIMSIHASKGLEFDHVFVIGLEERHHALPCTTGTNHSVGRKRKNPAEGQTTWAV